MSALPLGNYRIVDLGTAWAGPQAGQILADMGAEVVKVETRTRLDGLRLGRPIIEDDAAGGDEGLWPELQPVFHGLNRNKLSITLNLKTPEGLRLIRELIARSDVVLNNYSPGVLGRLGLDFPELRKVRPDIILVSMPSVGDSGPLRDILAYAPNIQALSGLSGVIGYQGEPLVGELQAPWSDAVAALHAALGTVAALRHRNRTGEGQSVEVAQLEATTSMLGEPLLDYQMTGKVAEPQGNFDPAFAPHNNYPCVEEDTWVAIAVQGEKEWEKFCRALENPGWTGDPRFEDRHSRVLHCRELDRHVAEWTRQHTSEEVTGLLQQHGVAAMPVMSIEGQFMDPHLQERQAFAEVEHPHVGAEWVYGMPWLLSDTPGSVRTAAPLLGQHNDYIIHELLGVPAAELECLRAAEVVY
jgi:benzylsuccinate CoA-transferase BbsF subunit